MTWRGQHVEELALQLHNLTATLLQKQILLG